MFEIDEKALECTGERYMSEPEFDGDWTLEHTHRYLLARELARDKVVLDIACGDGYGARMLADVAVNVIGVDISLKTVARAAIKYQHPRLFFLGGSATAIPLTDASVDLVTSFETIEHLAAQEDMLGELRRVLRSEGLLIISSPDKYEYSDSSGYENPYHVNELYGYEFLELLRARFSKVKPFGQRVLFGSVIAVGDDGHFFSWRKNEPESRTMGLSEAEYIISLAGEGSLPMVPSSVLKNTLEQSDRVLTLKQEKDILQREKETLQKELFDLEEKIAHYDRQLKAARDRILWFENWEKEILAHTAGLESNTQRLQQELATVLSSRAWRLTSPLRLAADHLKTLLRRKPPRVEPSVLGVWPPDVRVLENKTLLLQHVVTQSTVPLGVFLHIYYTDIAGEMLSCLHNLPRNAQVHISTDCEEKRESIEQIFSSEGFSDRVEIRVCPNRGWDQAPFFVGFADRIPQYPLILRLHSKRSTHIPWGLGESWRKMLFSSLAGTPERVNSIIQAFAEDPCLGMLCPPVVSYYARDVHFGANFFLMQSLLQEHGIAICPDTSIDFPVGSMFWCRPAVLSPWLDKKFSYDDFVPTAENNRDGTLAHALERLLFFGCGITGFSWGRL